jgi:hypothetical protein
MLFTFFPLNLLPKTSESLTGYFLMDRLTAFGLFAVTVMVFCYALEKHSRWFVLAFAGSCVLASVYGFLQGAWPFGLVEGVWSIIALWRWHRDDRTR